MPSGIMKPVREIMTEAPLTVRRELNLTDLISLFERHDFDGFPVVDAKGVLRGIVTKLDVLRVLRTPDAQRTALKVENIMRHGIITVEPDDPIVAAADLMVEARLHTLPVVQRHSGQPVLAGIVSRGDVLRRCLANDIAPGKPTSTPR